MSTKKETLEIGNKLLEMNKNRISNFKPPVKLTSPERYFYSLTTKRNKNAWKLAHYRYIG